MEVIYVANCITIFLGCEVVLVLSTAVFVLMSNQRVLDICITYIKYELFGSLQLIYLFYSVNRCLSENQWDYEKAALAFTSSKV